MNCLSNVTLHLVGGKSLSSTIAEKLCHSILSKIIVFFLFDLNPRPSTPPPSFDSVFVKMVGLLILEELGQLYQNKSLDNFSKLKANVLWTFRTSSQLHYEKILPCTKNNSHVHVNSP